MKGTRKVVRMCDVFVHSCVMNLWDERDAGSGENVGWTCVVKGTRENVSCHEVV